MGLKMEIAGGNYQTVICEAQEGLVSLRELSEVNLVRPAHMHMH